MIKIFDIIIIKIINPFFKAKLIIFEQISFAPSTNDIVSVFKDDTIYVWSSETIALKCQFNVESSGGQQTAKHFYKCFSLTG